jgi:hypothetical protein
MSGASAQARAATRAARVVYGAAAAAVVLGLGLLCWNQIARTLAAPIPMQLAIDSSHLGLPRPHGGSATIRGYSVNSVDVDLTHISGQLQWLIALGIVLHFLILIVVLLGLGVIWFRTSSGRPFARSVTMSLLAVAVVIGVAGSASEVVQSLINNREQYEALGTNGSGSYFSAVAGFTFTGTYLVAALLIGVLATAFAIGARLTRDTDGLV